MLAGLDEEYDLVVVVVQGKHGISWTNLQSDLLSYEKRLEYQMTLKSGVSTLSLSSTSTNQSPYVNMAQHKGQSNQIKIPPQIPTEIHREDFLQINVAEEEVVEDGDIQVDLYIKSALRWDTQRMFVICGISRNTTIPIKHTFVIPIPLLLVSIIIRHFECLRVRSWQIQ